MRRIDSYVIELEEEALGLAVSENDGGVTYHAVHPATLGLHGRTFADTVEAARAARSLLRDAA